MERRITGFHQDGEGEWVAELECGHGQHVRHRPPFQLRPWVVTDEGRRQRLGSALACPWCDEADPAPPRPTPPDPAPPDPAPPGPARPATAPPDDDLEEEGGDPACMAHLFCPECGSFVEGGHLEGCPAGGD